MSLTSELMLVTLGNYAEEVNDSIRLQSEAVDLFALKGYHSEMMDEVEWEMDMEKLLAIIKEWLSNVNKCRYLEK